jgi:hypothetical protein
MEPEDIATELLKAWLAGPVPKAAVAQGTGTEVGNSIGDAYQALLAKIRTAQQNAATGFGRR